MSQQTDDGMKWIEAQVNSIADELGIQFDVPPEWSEVDPLNFKMAVEVVSAGLKFPKSAD